MSFGDTLTASDIIRAKISKCLDNVPDYQDVKDTYTRLGIVRRDIKLLKRDIDEAEDTVIAASDRPRSNETRIAKLSATKTLKQELAKLESEEAELEMAVKFMEFHKAMYASASYQSRILYE